VARRFFERVLNGILVCGLHLAGGPAEAGAQESNRVAPRWPGFIEKAGYIGAASVRRLLVLSFLLSITSETAVRAEGASRDAKPVVRYEPFSIVSRWGPPIFQAELGRFRVPENRASGSSREIELAFVRLPSISKRPGPPIVWLSGGPGDSGIADLNTPILELFLELRLLGDVLILDQRGTGLSVPRLDCPGLLLFPYDITLDRKRMLDALEGQARACAQHWRAEGVDLAAYNIRESAEDLESLRVALGAHKLRLFAASFGTHLALAAIRGHQDRLDRAVLVGVVGPDQLRRLPSDFDWELDQIARLPRNGSVLTSDLLGAMNDVLRRLDSRSVTLEVETREAGRIRVVVGRFDLELYIRSLLSARRTIARLPALFASMAGGDFTELARVAARWRSSLSPPASIFTMRCASGSTRERELRIAKEVQFAALGNVTDFAEERVCRAWGVAPLSDEFRAPVRSSLPALFVSGTLDGDAPEDNATKVLTGFSKGQHLRVSGAAHVGLGFQDPATRAAIVRFFEGARLPSLCIELPALVFERPLAPGDPPSDKAVTQAVEATPPSIFAGGR
jgi:pimeloyl-ACP methyl ester carboxylesterase